MRLHDTNTSAIGLPRSSSTEVALVPGNLAVFSDPLFEPHLLHSQSPRVSHRPEETGCLAHTTLTSPACEKGPPVQGCTAHPLCAFLKQAPSPCIHSPRLLEPFLSVHSVAVSTFTCCAASTTIPSIIHFKFPHYSLLPP